MLIRRGIGSELPTAADWGERQASAMPGSAPGGTPCNANGPAPLVPPPAHCVGGFARQGSRSVRLSLCPRPSVQGSPEYSAWMQLRERLEIRRLAHERYAAHAGQVFGLQRLADLHGVDDVLDWLRGGVPTPALDVAVLSDLLAAGVSARCYRWLVASQ
jgi:hypothetical protein